METTKQLNRYYDRLALVLTVLVTALLVAACGLSGAPPPVQKDAGASPSGEKSGVWVGTIESIEGNALSLATVDGIIVATLSKDVTVRHFAAASLGELSIGQQVTVMGQKREDGIAARSVIVTPEGTSLVQSTDVPEGQGQRPGGAFAALVGTLERIDGEKITVKTEKGSIVASINVEETSIHLPSATSIKELSPGQLVTATGRENKEGIITATSVLITPDMGVLFRGRAPARAPDSPPPAGRETPPQKPIPAFDEQRKAGNYDGLTLLVTQDSAATFTIGERLALLPLPNKVVMRTSALSGEIRLDGKPSTIELDLRQLTSDQPLRDNFVRTSMFRENPTAVFTVEDARPLPEGFTNGNEVNTQVRGLLTIRGATFPINFDIKARDEGGAISILGRTSFTWADLGMKTPTAAVVLRVDDTVKVEVRLIVKPVLASQGS